MIAKSMRRIFVVAVLGLSVSLAASAHAQCCGTGHGYSAYYPSAHTAYSPVGYSSYNSYSGGWYPGYWLNRISARLWGSPTTYVASYPSSYYTSYAPSYSVGYRPAYSVGYRPAYSAGYATSYAAPAVGCSSCSSYSAAYAPCSTCTTACSPCSSCASGVSQAAYHQPSRCASCAGGAHAVQPGAVTVPGTAAPQQGEGTQQSQPQLAPDEQVGPRTFQQQRPANGTEQGIQPEPGSDQNGTQPYDTNGDPSTYFQPPKLFDPNDRTAQRSIAPVTTALYEKPAAYRQVSARAITPQQAQQDAAGWVSASN